MQSFKNHSRYVPLYHFVVPAILLLLLIAAGQHIYHNISEGADWHHPTLLFLAVIALWLMWFYLRAFALKAQDRVIILEEKLRHLQLTGKPLNPKLRPSQIIALRFASDAEFPSLAERAVNENLTSKQVKEAIQNWRADNHRV